MGNYIFKQCLDKFESNNEDQIPLFDYSNQIDGINEKCDDTNRFLNDEIIPVINELKSRIYNMEVKNNYLNRELASIKFKIKESDDEFYSIADESEKRSEIDKEETPVASLIDIEETPFTPLFQNEETPLIQIEETPVTNLIDID